MRRFFTATAALIVLAAVPAHAASAAQGTMKTCSATWSAKTDADKKATTYRAFMSTCMKGSGTTSAAAAPAPASTMAAAPAPTAAPAKSGTTMSACAAGWKTKSDSDKKTTTYNAYMSSCMKGGTATAVAKPAAPATAASSASAKAPVAAATAKPAATKSPSGKIPTLGTTGTSAKCKDGAVIPIKTHAGACSHHGGVAAWL